MPVADALNRAVRYGQTFWGWLTSGTPAFRERHLDSAPETAEGRAYGHFDARRSRYALYWALYSNTIYSRDNRWGASYKDLYDLHGFVRNIYSPCYRLGEFWATHIWGGPLDPEAGDGTATPSALPVITENEAIRPALAQVWKDSNWQEYKEVCTRYGSVLGDVAIAVVDDPARGKVYLRVVHPGTLARVDRDVFGNVKGYVIIEERPDPDYDDSMGGTRPDVLYREVCWREDDDPETIHYRTTKGDSAEPYDWRDYPPGTPDSVRVGGEWSEPYGFVPLVFLPHRDKGAGWGWSELLPILSKSREVDNLASILNDQVDKVVKAPRMITGAKAGAISWAVDDADDEDGGGRNQLPYLTTENENAAVHDVVGDLDIPGALSLITSIVGEIERDCTELRADEAGADASGVARIIARERIEAKVIQRRAPYDARFVQVCQMALSIGAMRAREGGAGGDGYAAFKGLPVDGFATGAFDFTIGDRPVFTITTAEKLEEATARGAALKALTDAGLPFAMALAELGYTATEIKAIVAQKEKDDAAALERMRQEQAISFEAEAAAMGDDGEDDPDGNRPPARVGGGAKGNTGGTPATGVR